MPSLPNDERKKDREFNAACRFRARITVLDRKKNIGYGATSFARTTRELTTFMREIVDEAAAMFAGVDALPQQEARSGMERAVKPAIELEHARR